MAKKGKKSRTKVGIKLIERPDQPSLLADLNKRHHAFYEEASRTPDENLDATTVKIAMEQLQSEASRGIPLNKWWFDRALADASKVRAVIRSEQARSAGKVSKADALQGLILQLVRQNPQVTDSELITRLEAEEKGGVIDDIDDGGTPSPCIHFSQAGRSKAAPISGLKDRLCRAKKIIAKELAQTR